MNKTFLASSVVMLAAAALGWWIVAEPGSSPSQRKRFTSLPASTKNEETPESPALIGPPRDIDEFIALSSVFGPTGGELDLQNLLDSVNPEFLSEPRAVAEDPLADAGEEPSSPPDGFTLLMKRAFRFAACKCAELMVTMEPLIGTVWPSGIVDKSESLFGGVPTLTDDTMEARPSDLQK
jgi:hypothetical protein